MSVEAERAMCRREERENASRIRSSEVEVEGTMRSEEGRTLRSPSTSGRYDRGGCTALHRHHSTALPASSLLVCLPPCLVNTPITSNILGFRIYRGKGGYDTSQNVLHHTVMDLVQPWTGHHRTLYFDNLFASPALCDDLLREKTRSCGTCRPNRSGLPPAIKQTRARLPKGEMRAWQRGQLGCLMWHDAKPVLFLTTHLRPDRVTPLEPSPGHPATSRPTAAVDYNYNKGHVDQVDQVRSYHVVQRRGRRTWPALAWWLLDMCIINAHRLWDLQHSTETEILHFREQLLEQIAALYPSPRTPVQPTVPAVAQRGFVGHWPEDVEVWRNCVQCSTGRNHRRKTTFRCLVCRKHLHPHKCFGAYHEGLRIDNRTL